jgi:hypothetical protein
VVGVVNAAKLLALRGHIQAANARRCFKFGSARPHWSLCGAGGASFLKRCPAWSFWSSFSRSNAESSGGR